MAYRDPAGVVWVGSPFGLWRSDRGRFVPVALPDVRQSSGIQAATHGWRGRPVGLHRAKRRVPRGPVSAGCRSAIGRPAARARHRAHHRRRPDAPGSATPATGWRGSRATRSASSPPTTACSVGNVLAIHVRGAHVWVGGEFGLARARGRPLPAGDRAGTAPSSGVRRASSRRPTARCGSTARSASRGFPPPRCGACCRTPPTRWSTSGSISATASRARRSRSARSPPSITGTDGQALVRHHRQHCLARPARGSAETPCRRRS